MKIETVIKAPILTEKATDLAGKNVYAFEVHEKANKAQIRAVLQKLYKVKVDRVAIVKRKGKTRRVGRTMKIKHLPGRKIAYVSVSEGTIDVFPKA